MKQKGLTLIELMIVIAIIGILATIAIPTYQDYMVRAKITEGLTIASSAQTTVSENAISGNPDLSLGWAQPNPTALVQSVTISGNSGVITITYTSLVHNIVLNMIPSAQGIPLSAGIPPVEPITWTCAVTDTKNNRYVPSTCRIKSK